MKRRRPGILENLMRSGMLLKPSMPLYAKVTFLNLTTILCMLLFAFFGLTNLTSGKDSFAMFEFTLSLAFVFSFLMARLTSRTAPSSLINSLLIYVGAAVLVITGGTEGTGIYWLIIIPLLFLNYWGRKLGLVWVMGLLVIILSVLALNVMGIVYVAYSSYEVLVFTASLVVFSLLLWTHDYLDHLKLKYLGDEDE